MNNIVRILRHRFVLYFRGFVQYMYGCLLSYTM